MLFFPIILVKDICITLNDATNLLKNAPVSLCTCFLDSYHLSYSIYLTPIEFYLENNSTQTSIY